MASRNSVLAEIFVGLDLETQLAIVALEEAGLHWCAHFGYKDAVQIKSEMDAAFAGGALYEWLQRRFGIGGGE